MTLHRLRQVVQPPARLLDHVGTSCRQVVDVPAALSNALQRPVATTGLGLGTSRTWVVRRRSGVACHEPSCLVMDGASRKPRHIGEGAFKLDGREPPGLQVARPVVGGRVQRRDQAVAMVRQFLHRAGHLDHRVVLSVPHELTVAERRTLEQVVLAAGARQVYTVDESLVSALGVGLDPMEARTVMTIDLGASCTRISVMALGEVVLSAVLPVGGNALDEAIREHFAHAHHLKIGLRTAERVKQTIGDSLEGEPDRGMAVDGMSTVTGLPTRVQATSTEVAAAMAPVLSTMVNHVRKALEEVKPQALADVVENHAIVLIGGGARLPHMRDMLAQRTQLPVTVPDNAERAAAAGVDRLLRDCKLRRQLLSPPSRAIVPIERTQRKGNVLAWTLGILSLVLVWQMSGPLLARTTVVDSTLTAFMVPVWSRFTQLTSHATPSRPPLDPVQQALLTQVRERDRRIHLLAADNRRLRKLVHMRGQLPAVASMQAGQVVARDPSAWLQTLVLDVGRRSHVTPGAAVVSDNGIVGHVTDVSDNSARVQTLTAHGATMAAVVEKRHAAGVVYGLDGHTCELRYLDPNAGVRAGDVVVTSGQDRYPEGLAVGRVLNVRPASDGVSMTATLQPAVSLDTVRDVLIVHGKKS